MPRLLTAVALFAVTACGSSQPPPSPPPSPAAPPHDAAVPADAAPTVHDRMTSIVPDALAWAPHGSEPGVEIAPLWGDRAIEPSGFFLRYPAGYPGQLQSHRSDYHAIAVTGTPRNPQDGAKHAVPLSPPTAYWYQPGGVAHRTTCAQGAPCIVLAHTTGPLVITPAEPVRGARRDPRYFEKRARDLRWEPLERGVPALGERAALWGAAASQPSGMFLRIPAGNAPYWHVHAHDYHAVVLAGTIVQIESGSEPRELVVGAYWRQPGGYKHAETCKAGGPDCIAYVYFTGPYLTKAVE